MIRGKIQGIAHTANVFRQVGSNAKEFFLTVTNTEIDIIKMLKSMACTES